MLAVLTGLIGAIVGWLLKTVSDVLAERRANERADTIWRRTKYVDAVAELLYSARMLLAADVHISRAIHALSNAENGGNPDTIKACRAKEREASEAQEPWRVATLRALESVRLYGPEGVVSRADAVWDAILNGGTYPERSEIRAYEQSVAEALERLRVEVRDAGKIERPASLTSSAAAIPGRDQRPA